MTISKREQWLLSHLTPIGPYADEYLCGIYFKGKEDHLYSVYDQMQNWVENNGGVIFKLSEKVIVGEKKGFRVKVRFPSYGKRDMKGIMATLFEK